MPKSHGRSRARGSPLRHARSDAQSCDRPSPLLEALVARSGDQRAYQEADERYKRLKARLNRLMSPDLAAHERTRLLDELEDEGFAGWRGWLPVTAVRRRLAGRSARSQERTPGAACQRRAARHARASRYQSLHSCLLEAQEELELGLRQGGDDEGAQVWALNKFLEELIRVTRADSRLLTHPIVAKWVRQARAFGWRSFLAKLPGGLEKGVRPPLKPKHLNLWYETDTRRWPTKVAGYAAAGEPRAAMSLRSVHRILTLKGLIPKMSYQRFSALVGDGAGGGKLGKLLL